MLRPLLILFVALVLASIFWFSIPPKGTVRFMSYKTASDLTLDGTRLKVRWLDGDTFVVLSPSPWRGAKARLKLFNTLESYGAVHKWGHWTSKQLAANAHAATLAARKGHWHCKTHGKRDRYNRVLTSCMDLATALVSKGLAHIFSMKNPAPPPLIKVQAEAQAKKRGMWAKGIPPFLLTSVHSAHESKRTPYNRLISTKDGHSELIKHKKTYRTCQWVCEKGSCLLYVPYKRRHGKNKASCL